MALAAMLDSPLCSNIPVSLHRDIRASHNQTNTQTKAEEKENKYKPIIFILIKLNNSLGKEGRPNLFYLYIYLHGCVFDI